MEQRAPRWVGWSILLSLALVCLLTAGFLAFWCVVWPFSPGFVRKHTPWIFPFVRASAIVDGTDQDFGIQHEEAASRFRQLLSVNPSKVQAGLVTCLQGHDQEARREALDWVGLVAEQTELEPDLCAEIIRATTEVEEENGIKLTAIQIVRFLPDAETRHAQHVREWRQVLPMGSSSVPAQNGQPDSH